MLIILLLIGISLGMALTFLALFVWAIRSGQFDDTHTPSIRVLFEQPTRKAGKNDKNQIQTQPSPE